MRSLRFSKASLALPLVLFGCQSAMPGAAGHVELGDGVDATKFRTLEIRAMVANDGSSLAEAKMPTAVAEDIYLYGTKAAPIWLGETQRDEEGVVFLQLDASLTTVRFPHYFKANGRGGTGFTTEQRWRLFAWLSNEDDSQLEVAPPSGSPYGVADYEALDCGMNGDGFCGVSQGVDVTLDRTAP